MSHQFQPCTSSPLSSTCTPCNQVFCFPALLEWMMMTRRVELQGDPTCTYFQQKYKHLCRLERADSRQKKHAAHVEEGLAAGASREPECVGQLIQELQRATRSRARSELHTATCFLRTHLVLFSLFFERIVKTQRVVDILS